MPELVELRPSLAERGVRVVAVSIDLAEPAQVTSADQLRAFVERRGFAVEHVAFDGDWDALTTRLGLPGGPPSTLLLGKDGAEVGRIDGPAGEAELEQLVADALAR